jgi:hypothetical protein
VIAVLPPALAAALDRDGHAVVPGLLTPAEVDRLAAALDAAAGAGARRGGRRNLFEIPAVRDLARAAPLTALVEAVLGPGAGAVRAILFDKTPAANWRVSWHQDLTIAVRRRVEAAGFAAWTEKAGVPHVQPPVAVLERMLAVRV